MASDFRSVAKARSGAVFKNGSGFVFTMEGEGGWVIGHWTAWVDRGLEHQVPSHLVLEVQSSHSTGIDEARPRFEAIANHSAALLSFVANTAIEQPVTEIMYDASPGLLKRDFRQAFVRDPEAWPLMGGRVFKNDELASFFETYFAEGAATARLRRGIYQYGLALQRWRFGTEHQALQHLWIAAENIRNLFRDKRTPKADRKEYAKSIGIPIEGSWQNRLDNVVMQEDVFNGDTLVFKAAMKASDALEHGYEDLSKIQAHAVEHGHAAFTHLRTALLRLIDPATSLPESLASRPPLDVDSRRKIIHGQLVSESPVDPAALGGEKWRFPHLHWRSRLNDFQETEEGYTFGYAEKLTVRTSDAVGFRGTAMAMTGRLLPGDELQTSHLPPPGGIGDSIEDLNDLCDFMERIHRAAAHGMENVRIRPGDDLPLFGSLTDLLGLYEVVLLLLRRSRWIEAAPITAQLIESSIKLIHAESEDRISPLLADGWSGAIRVGQLADELRDSLGEPDDPETVTKAQTLMDDFEAIRNRLTIHEVRDMSSAIGFEEAVWPWLLGEVLAGGNLSDIARFLGPDEGFSTTRADFDNERCIGLAATKALILVRALVADRLELAADLQLEQLVTWMDELVATAYSQQATDSESGR